MMTAARAKDRFRNRCPAFRAQNGEPRSQMPQCPAGGDLNGQLNAAVQGLQGIVGSELLQGVGNTVATLLRQFGIDTQVSVFKLSSVWVANNGMFFS